MNNLQWSPAEKKIARRVFDAALKRECEAALEKLKNMAAAANSPEDMWVIHDFLSDKRKTIDRKYDYSYSQLVMVFGVLLREKWTEEKELSGLSEDKLNAIRSIASF